MFLLFLMDMAWLCACFWIHLILETLTWNTDPGNKTLWSTAPLGCVRVRVSLCVCVCVCVCVCGHVCVGGCMNCWLEGCFPSFNMLLRFSSPRDLVKRQILIQGPRFCIFSKFPSDANASSWWTTLGTVRGDVVLSL